MERKGAARLNLEGGAVVEAERLLVAVGSRADEMGRIAAGNALSRRPPRRFHPEWIPWVTFTDPEVA